MARDAIARQSDVDKDSVVLYCEPNKGRYSPGTITFEAKKGKSLNLEQIRESIAATRLSGYTNMRVDSLEITVRGKLGSRNKELVLAVAGTDQELRLFVDSRELEKQLFGLAAKGGEENVTLVGRVDGWNGRFPVILKLLAERYGPAAKTPMLVVVTGLAGGQK